MTSTLLSIRRVTTAANILKKCSSIHHRHRNQLSIHKQSTSSSSPSIAVFSTSSSSSSPLQNENNNTPHPKQIIVAMSGGVDSSVSAHLLLQNHPPPHTTITGLYMTNWDSTDEDNSIEQKCAQSEEDLKDVSKVCQHLNIALKNVNFTSDYWMNVFEPFVEALSSCDDDHDDDGGTKDGRTWMPNPDVACNSMVKFGVMKDYARDVLKGNYVATGHYARLWRRRRQQRREISQIGEKKNEEDDCLEEYKGSQEELKREIEQDLKGTDAETWIYSWGVPSSSSSSFVPCPLLIAGADLSKDQSYFLSGVSGSAFHNVLFPLGHLMKTTTSTPLSMGGRQEEEEEETTTTKKRKSVRDIAMEANLPNATKRESMGICFIGKRNFSKFMSEYIPKGSHFSNTSEKKGGGEKEVDNFIDVDTGKVVGTVDHDRVYTIGQGAKIPGAARKWFVVGRSFDYNLDFGSNNVADGSAATTPHSSSSIFVCGDTHHPALYSDELYVRQEDFNWIGGGNVHGDGDYGSSEPPTPLVRGESMMALCRTRHLQPLFGCDVTWDRTNARYIIQFHKPIRAVTPGQVVAIYIGKEGLICLGGGPIWDRGPSYHERGLTLPLDLLHPSGSNDLSLDKKIRSQ